MQGSIRQLTFGCLSTVSVAQISPSHRLQPILKQCRAWSPAGKCCRMIWTRRSPPGRLTYPSGLVWGQTYSLQPFEPWLPCDTLFASPT